MTISDQTRQRQAGAGRNRETGMKLKAFMVIMFSAAGSIVAGASTAIFKTGDIDSAFVGGAIGGFFSTCIGIFLNHISIKRL